jgi:hypothetical protein
VAASPVPAGAEVHNTYVSCVCACVCVCMCVCMCGCCTAGWQA